MDRQLFGPLRGRLRKTLFKIPQRETSFEYRGFNLDNPKIRRHLETIANNFVEGYHFALSDPEPSQLNAKLQTVPFEYRGFAFEGASMALAILDSVSPWNRGRFQAFLAGPGSKHIYMLHVGAGWAKARIPWSLGRFDELDPLLRWLVFDGYGFHDGFFHSKKSIRAKLVPKRIQGYAARTYDQGLGRSLWFVHSADPARIANTIAGFPESRRADLWSGVGLAAAYAGGLDRAALEVLHARSVPFQAELAQGVTFAAKARQRAGNPVAHTERACRVIWGMNVAATAKITDDALINLPKDSKLPAYEIWRQRIQRFFAKQMAA